MEVKDINSLATMLVSNRAQKAEGQHGTQSALQNFRDLFSQGSLFEFQGAEKTSMSQKTSLMDETSKSEVPQKKVEKNKSKATTSDVSKGSSSAENKSHKTEDKTTQNAAAKEDASKKDEENTASIKDSNQSTESAAENKEEKASSSEIQSSENPNENQGASVNEDGTVENVTDEEAEIAQENTKDIVTENILPEMQNLLLPEMLENMGALTVYNSIDNTYSVMTGEEISDMLSSSSLNVNAYLSEDGRSDITIMQPIDILTTENITPNISLEGFENVEPSTMEIIPETENTADIVKSQHQAQETETLVQQRATEEFVEDTVSKQSEKLSEILGTDKKINMNVNVEEENFSYQTAKVTVKEVLASADAPQTKGEDKAQINTEVDAQTSTQTNNISGNSAGNVVSAQVVPAQDMNSAGKVTIQNAQTTAVKGLSEANSNNMTHLAGADNAAQGLKAENGVATENKSSFRDIYKGMSREVAEQVKVNITKSAVKGVDSIEIKLKPEELGHIEIKMQLSKDGKLQAHIIVSRAETGELLQKELPSLEKAFTEAGFNLDDGSLSFSYREDNSAKEQNSELRNFIGRVLEQDAENENTQEYGPHLSETWDGTSALNIRV